MATFIIIAITIIFVLIAGFFGRLLRKQRTNFFRTYYGLWVVGAVAFGPPFPVGYFFGIEWGWAVFCFINSLFMGGMLIMPEQ